MDTAWSIMHTTESEFSNFMIETIAEIETKFENAAAPFTRL